MVTWSDDYQWTDDVVCHWVSMFVFLSAVPDAASCIYYGALHDSTKIAKPLVQGYIDSPFGISDSSVDVLDSS